MFDSVVERTSFCRVSKSHDGKSIQLIRLADIEGGILREFYQDEEMPKSFANRDRLYWRDGLDSDVTFGIWNWTASPNKTDPSKDYITMSYDRNAQVIEVVRIHGATTIKKLVEMIEKGLSIPLACNSVLLCVEVGTILSAGKFEGVLCTRADINMENTLLTLRDDVYSLPLYSFGKKDIISLDGKQFYRNLDCGSPQGNILVKEPLEIVRDVVVSRASWSAVKPLNVTRDIWRSVRELVSKGPERSLYEEIAEVCLCDEKKAKEYVDDFMSRIEQYIGPNDLDSSVLEGILKSSPALMQECEHSISEKWRREHKGELEKAQKELDEVKGEIQKKFVELEKKESEITSLTDKLEKLGGDLQSKEQLLDDVSKKVRERISDARRDVANFIAEMVFTQPCNLISTDNITRASGAYFIGKSLISDEQEDVSNWKEAISSLEYELPEAGVSNKYSDGFAAFLYSSFINHFPLLLAGPNGESIVDAFSLSLFGKTAGIIDCSCPYSREVVKEVCSSSDPVVMIKHALRNEWVTHIPEFNNNAKYFFIVHPFVEDLFIEPKSLFSYALPFFTDLIIDSTPTRQFLGSHRSESFEEYPCQKSKDRNNIYGSLLASLGFNTYIRSRIQSVITDFQAIMGSRSEDLDCLFAIFSYAFIANSQQGSLLDKFENKMKIGKDLKKELTVFMGMDDA